MLSYQAEHLLGRLRDETGDLDGAAAAFQRAMDDVDWVRGGIIRDDLRISFVQDKVALYEDAVRNALRRGNSAEAFAYVERARARALVDLLATGPSLPLHHASEEDAALARRIEDLRSALSGLYNRLHGEGDQRQRFADGHAALFEQMRHHEQDLSAALHQLRAGQAEYVSLGTGSIARLEEVRAWLQEGDLLVEYYVLGEEILAFLVTHQDLRVVGPLALTSAIQDLVLQWRFHLSHFHYGQQFIEQHAVQLTHTAQALLHDLHTLLIAPLATYIDGHSLVIVPHGPLHHVPLHALYDGRRYLVEQHDISYAPSATAVVVQRSRKRAGDGVLVVGVASPALPYIAEEVAAVASCHAGARVLQDAGATRAMVSAAAAGSRCVHLATHAIFRADNPLYSAVQLADDWLTVSDIYSMDLVADLVVLSACDTGTSSISQGDELIGLTRGFLFAGAQTLVTSLWAANDASTATLMSTFHHEIGAGATPRHALCAAQRRVPCSYCTSIFLGTVHRLRSGRHRPAATLWDGRGPSSMRLFEH